jgi:hypothetical protein
MAPAVLKSVEDDMVEAWFSITLGDLLRFDGGDCWSLGTGREGDDKVSRRGRPRSNEREIGWTRLCSLKSPGFWVRGV